MPFFEGKWNGALVTDYNPGARNSPELARAESALNITQPQDQPPIVPVELPVIDIPLSEIDPPDNIVHETAENESIFGPPNSPVTVTARKSKVMKVVSLADYFSGFNTKAILGGVAVLGLVSAMGLIKVSPRPTRSSLASYY